MPPLVLLLRCSDFLVNDGKNKTQNTNLDFQKSSTVFSCYDELSIIQS